MAPIRKRAYTRDGRSWTRFVATYDAGFDAAGRRDRRKKSFRRERDAKEWIAGQRALARAGITTMGRVPTVAEHINEWLSRGKTRTRRPWAPITAHGYESVARTWLIPHLGRIPLDKLTVTTSRRCWTRCPVASTPRTFAGRCPQRWRWQ